MIERVDLFHLACLLSKFTEHEYVAFNKPHYRSGFVEVVLSDVPLFVDISMDGIVWMNFGYIKRVRIPVNSEFDPNIEWERCHFYCRRS